MTWYTQLTTYCNLQVAKPVSTFLVYDLTLCLLSISFEHERGISQSGIMDGEYDPTQDDDVASDHIDDDEAGPSKRKTAGAAGAKDDVGQVT